MTNPIIDKIQEIEKIRDVLRQNYGVDLEINFKQWNPSQPRLGIELPSELLEPIAKEPQFFWAN